MFIRTFNPGPSQVSDAVKADIALAVSENIISISHRSDKFADITRQAVDGLRQYFNVPPNYHVLFTTSAHDAMELIIRNLVKNESFHFVNGNFSSLFANISEAFGKKAVSNIVDWGEQNNFKDTVVPASAEIITLAYNETSTGVACTNKDVKSLHKRNPEPLLVVDITSAAGCGNFHINDADVWFFSVQKGMGLPSGLGVMFISPRALDRALQFGNAGIFNFERMARNIDKHQTIQTPNVLGIYLLSKQLGRWNQPGVAMRQLEETNAKAKQLQQFIESHSNIGYFVQNPNNRSLSTVCVVAEPATIAKLHNEAATSKLVIGAGYGKLKANTCRIANFPALTRGDMQLLIKTLSPAAR